MKTIIEDYIENIVTNHMNIIRKNQCADLLLFCVDILINNSENNNYEKDMRQTIISHRNYIFNDEYTNDYSILSGESGTILTLINGIYLGKEYPKLLMID